MMVYSPLPTSNGSSAQPIGPAVDADAALMLLSRDSLDATFSTLVHRYKEPLLNFFQRQGAREESPDLTQETFIRLYRYRDRYRATSKFSSFLYTLARNAWADHGRKIMRRERLTSAYGQENAANALPPPPPALDMNFSMDLETAKSVLSPKHLEVIDLYFFQGLRQQEISARLRIPLGTVKSRLNHALRDLRTHLHHMREGDDATPKVHPPASSKTVVSRN